MSAIITQDEKENLELILAKLRESYRATEGRVSIASDKIRENKEHLWNNIHEIDGAEKASIRQSIAIAGLTGDSLVKKSGRIRKLIKSPYFGRIDFVENNGLEPLPIYVGIHSFHEESTNENLICDWRAPISSLFYDFELGDAAYESPSGKIEGGITLKRQFRIRNSIMEFMLENSVNIRDDILQKELSSTSDEKMKSIVATIQKDQNLIIRNDSSSVLIIQGAAGSGKTSIALHRIAFLLYKHRDSIASCDIMILSPNSVFADYISNVLPELGEETIPENDFDKIASAELGSKIHFQTFFDQVSTLLESPDPLYVERIKYKATFTFLEKLRLFIAHIENDYFTPAEIKSGRVVVPADYVAQRYAAYRSDPIKIRLKKVADDIVHKIKMSPEFEKGLQSVAGTHSTIRKMFKTLSTMKIYREFYTWLGDPSKFKTYTGGVLEFCDVFPLVYLNLKIGGTNGYGYNKVKHLVVDEMQDYTPVQYAVLAELFKCKKTILGDANQSVNPYSSTSCGEIQRVFRNAERFKLNKSYRSSFEITTFAQNIRRNAELIPIERHGEEPVVKILVTEAEQIQAIHDTLLKNNVKAYSTIGVISKTQRAAAKLFDQLRVAQPSIWLLSPESRFFTKGIVITTAHMAKGLEFDQVIIPYADPHTYNTEIDRSMLYIACTRALHSLCVFSVKELTPFIRTISGR